MTIRLEDRRARLFWLSVRKTDFCWFWKAAVNKCGYGLFGAARSGSQLAHRWAWELTRGPIPDGMSVCHTCDNRRCVNPQHLFIGTHAENMRDMAEKGRMPSRKGADSPSAKVTEAQVIEIRNNGEPAHHIARRLGLTLQGIQAIRKRKTWKHI